MGEKKRRVTWEIIRGPDGWIKVVEGVFPVRMVSGCKRLLYRVSEDSEGITIIENRLGGVLTLDVPLLVIPGHQCKIEAIET